MPGPWQQLAAKVVPGTKAVNRAFTQLSPFTGAKPFGDNAIQMDPGGQLAGQMGKEFMDHSYLGGGYGGGNLAHNMAGQIGQHNSMGGNGLMGSFGGWDQSAGQQFLAPHVPTHSTKGILGMPPPPTPAGGTFSQAASSLYPSPGKSAGLAPSPAVAPAAAPASSGGGPAVPRNPFFRDANGYGGKALGKDNLSSKKKQDWYDTGASADFGEKNHDAMWTVFLSRNGADGQDAFGKWARGLLPQVEDGYKAAFMSNPKLTFRKYLNTVNGTLQGLYAQLSPEQRGVDIATQVKTIYPG